MTAGSGGFHWQIGRRIVITAGPRKRNPNRVKDMKRNGGIGTGTERRMSGHRIIVNAGAPRRNPNHNNPGVKYTRKSGVISAGPQRRTPSHSVECMRRNSVVRAKPARRDGAIDGEVMMRRFHITEAWGQARTGTPATCPEMDGRIIHGEKTTVLTPGMEAPRSRRSAVRP